MNMYTHSTYCIYIYARTSVPACMDVGGAYGGRWASDGVCVIVCMRVCVVYCYQGHTHDNYSNPRACGPRVDKYVHQSYSC